MNISLKLEYPDDRKPLYSLEEINGELGIIGTKIWTLDLKNAPSDIRYLLKKTVLTDEEKSKILQHFLMPMEKLLEIVKKAGRSPHVHGGGELITTVTTHGYSYPQLYIAEEGIDYSRFDKLHINVAAEGTGVDEIGQILSGGPFIMYQKMPGGDVLKTCVDCPDEDTGWLITYDGKVPHIGSLTKAETGTKALVQVIGPKEWEMQYLE